MKRTVVGLVGAALALTSCGGGGDGLTAAAPTTTVQKLPLVIPPAHEQDCPGSAERIEYIVRGSAKSVTYTVSMPDGITQGEGRPPLSGGDLTVCVPAGAFATMSVQNRTDAGYVECSIRRDAKPVAANKAQGAFLIAQCSN